MPLTGRHWNVNYARRVLFCVEVHTWPQRSKNKTREKEWPQPGGRAGAIGACLVCAREWGPARIENISTPKFVPRVTSDADCHNKARPAAGDVLQAWPLS